MGVDDIEHFRKTTRKNDGLPNINPFILRGNASLLAYDVTKIVNNIRKPTRTIESRFCQSV